MRTERSYKAIRVSLVALAASAWLVGQVSIVTNRMTMRGPVWEAI
jgi:hypothetical protein